MVSFFIHTNGLIAKNPKQSSERDACSFFSVRGPPHDDPAPQTNPEYDGKNKDADQEQVSNSYQHRSHHDQKFSLPRRNAAPRMTPGSSQFTGTLAGKHEVHMKW